jgi:isoamylase
MLAILLLSQGTPMILAGDEFGRTQKGNNNAYCQDNDISWVDWSLAEKNAKLLKFSTKLCALRHKYPILRRNLFLNGEHIEELDVRDVTWINPKGSEMGGEDWQAPVRCLGMLLDGRAQTTGIRQRGKEATILIVINGHHDAVDFTLPEVAGASCWCLLIDTDVSELQQAAPLAVGASYASTARSVVLFVLDAESKTE